jgi:hypothetical protein
LSRQQRQTPTHSWDELYEKGATAAIIKASYLSSKNLFFRPIIFFVIWIVSPWELIGISNDRLKPTK